jgi:uncharacterized membrane protein YidH (DUF202 family)
MTDQLTGSPSDYLAAERIFLAWIRTGLALMGFGFVVALWSAPSGDANHSTESATAAFWPFILVRQPRSLRLVSW